VPDGRSGLESAPRPRRRLSKLGTFAVSTFVSLSTVLAFAAAPLAWNGDAGSAARRALGASASAAARPHANLSRVARPPAGLSVRVRGNELVDANGNQLRLIGVNRSGTQYMCALGRGIFDGPADPASIAAMKSWRINAVRVPLNEDCWLGINGLDPAYVGAAYRAAIEAYVHRLNAAGLYVILELHWNAPGREQALGQKSMVDASHGYALWRSVAATFKSDRAVLFDLYNEPHSLGATPAEEWRCWATGCAQFAGMDGLLATVRSTGARNVVLIAGLGWAADESGWLQHEPHDPIHQLAATFHVYREHSLCTTESCWNRTLLPVAARVPLIADEFGEMQCGDPTSVAWLNSWMTYATAHRFSLLAWAWDANRGNCAVGPLLIANYTGAPTPFGAAVEAYYSEHGAR
jgi:endoglucanase